MISVYPGMRRLERLANEAVPHSDSVSLEFGQTFREIRDLRLAELHGTSHVAVLWQTPLVDPVADLFCLRPDSKDLSRFVADKLVRKSIVLR